MSAVHKLITDHLDSWTAADTEKKSGRGRASGNANSVYGIKKLRELILELAVRGKLVPQDISDEPTSELVKRITSEKKLWVKEGKIRNGKPLPQIEPTEETYVKPHNWEWIRLGDLGDWGAGATPSRANSSYYGGTTPWFKSGELTADFIDTAEETVTELALKECSLRLNQPGDVLIAMYGATIGKTAILKAVATTNQAVCACTPCTGILNTYLLVLLKALKSNFIGQGAGGAQPNISREKIIATVAALPPTEEQNRIVAKVDELMALCDQLEAQHNNAADAHEQLVSHLLSTLTQSQDAADFNANWQRIATHFDTLFTTESSIDALKQTLLQLAVMGKLVPQDPNDEPASELLKRIQAEKAKLVADRRIKKDAAIPPINENDVSFRLPRNWTAVQMANICIQITDGTHQTPKYMPLGRPFLSAQNVKPFKFMPHDHKFVSQEDFDNLRKNRIPEKGDILLTRVGAMIGEAAVIDIEFEFAFYVSLGLLKPSKQNISSEFIVLWLNSPLGTNTSIKNTLGRGVSAGNLNLSLIRNFVIGLPPLHEQNRIVSKIEELMELCECLKSRIADANQCGIKTANAITTYNTI